MLISHAQHARTRSRIAVLTIFSLLGSSTGPLVSAQTPTATQKPAPTADDDTEAGDGTDPTRGTEASHACANRRSEAGHWTDASRSRRGARRGRPVAARLHDQERRRGHHLSAASGELDGSEARGPVRGGGLRGKRRQGARPGQPQGGVRHQRRPGRTARQLLGVQDHRVELPDHAARARSRPWSRRSSPRCRSKNASSPSSACWPASTRARSSRRTSKA